MSHILDLDNSVAAVAGTFEYETGNKQVDLTEAGIGKAVEVGDMSEGFLGKQAAEVADTLAFEVVVSGMRIVRLYSRMLPVWVCGCPAGTWFVAGRMGGLENTLPASEDYKRVVPLRSAQIPDESACKPLHTWAVCTEGSRSSRRQAELVCSILHRIVVCTLVGAYIPSRRQAFGIPLRTACRTSRMKVACMDVLMYNLVELHTWSCLQVCSKASCKTRVVRTWEQEDYNQMSKQVAPRNRWDSLVLTCLRKQVRNSVWWGTRARALECTL